MNKDAGLEKTQLERRRISLINETGSALIIVVIVIMILSTIGLYGLTASGVEIAAATSEKRDKKEFACAEAGLKFARINFEPIYENDDKTGSSGKLYPTVGSEFDGDGRPATLAMGSNGTLSVLYTPNSGGTALRDYSPDELSSSYVAFDYSVDGVRIARIEIKAIQKTRVSISALTSKANDVPSRSHLTAAPPGYDVDAYKSRNFCITSTALKSDGTLSNISVQSGIWIPAELSKFNQFKTL